MLLTASEILRFYFRRLNRLLRAKFLVFRLGLLERGGILALLICADGPGDTSRTAGKHRRFTEKRFPRSSASPLETDCGKRALRRGRGNELAVDHRAIEDALRQRLLRCRLNAY